MVCACQMKKSFWEGFSALPPLGGFLFPALRCEQSVELLCALSWEFQSLCGNDRGKALLVCLMVGFWPCTEVTVLINPRCSVLCETLGKAGRSPGRGCRRGFQPPASTHRMEAEHWELCRVLLSEWGFPQLCSFPLAQDTPPLLLHWPLQEMPVQLSFF